MRKSGERGSSAVMSGESAVVACELMVPCESIVEPLSAPLDATFCQGRVRARPGLIRVKARVRIGGRVSIGYVRVRVRARVRIRDT